MPRGMPAKQPNLLGGCEHTDSFTNRMRTCQVPGCLTRYTTLENCPECGQPTTEL